MDCDERIRCLVAHALNDHGHVDFERNESIGNHILANLKEAGFLTDERATLTSPAPAGGEANDLERVASALVILARTNIPTDIQDLLVNGDPDRGIAPGALGKAIAFALTPPPASGDVAGVVERLRERISKFEATGYEAAFIDLKELRGIATLLESLSAEKGRLTEALQPFAKIADEYADQEDDDFQVWKDFDVLGATLPLRNFRRARTALTPKEKA